MRVLLQVPLNPYSGYGQDGIGMARAFYKMGADVHLQPVTVQAPLPPEIAAMLCKEAEPPFDLYIHHVDPMMLGTNENALRVSDVKVAWTMWEYTSFENLPKEFESLTDRLAPFDALVAYDHPTMLCFRDFQHDDQALIKVQGGFDPELWPYVDRDWDGRFGFCMNGALSHRKDPFVAIEAFRELKEEYPDEFEPAELHLKTSVRGLHSGLQDLIPKLRIHEGVWPQDVLLKFYAAQHVLLAPSRGEGKNVPALEFQSTGGAVIATNWGGHKEWLHPDYAYPLDYVLKPQDPAFPSALNARASTEHLKELMLHAFRNRAEVKQKGLLASRIIPETASWDHAVQHLLQRLKDTTAGGEKLWQKASFCESRESK